MLSFLGDIERFLADLYPYRWLVLAGLLIVMAAAVAFGYRRGWHVVAMRHRRGLAVVLTPSVLLAAVAAWFLLSPLFTNVTVDEELPFDIAAIAAPSTSASEAETAKTEVAKGSAAAEQLAPENAASADKPAAGGEAGTPVPASQETQSSTDTTEPASTPTVSNTTVASGAPAVASTPVPTKAPAPADPAATPEPTAVASSEPASTPEQAPTPTAIPTPTPAPPPTPAPEPTATAVAQAVAVKLKSGMFRDADNFHKGSGLATVYRGPDGSLLLRLDDFKVTNGPDLHVVMTSHPDPKNKTEVMSEGYLDLGKLKGNIGNQNYAIPAGVDVAVHRSVVIYCLPFHVVFSVATLVDEG